MKEDKISCRTVRYREFPDLLFGTSQEDGPVYFDATHFIRARGDAHRHNVRDFRASFHHWITALTDVYGIDKNLCPVENEHHFWPFKCTMSHVVLIFALIPPL